MQIILFKLVVLEAVTLLCKTAKEVSFFLSQKFV